ncbi:MAG TPA: large conductance mechanosensitive channel protein MscL [Acholeplasmataceae bacterium]|nr:large conductance mechanosensitive channel protein MscL [Acholeplasmataceae bacterium]
MARKKRAKTFFAGFKDFVTRGNIVDLAIGVVIGGAFGKIVTSLVNDVIMPPISLLLGNQEIGDLKWVLRDATLDTAGAVIDPEIALRYGAFIMLIIEFLIIAFAIYAVVTLIIRRRAFLEKVEAEEKARQEASKPKVEEVKEVVIPEDIKLLTEIRDLLKKQD